MTVQDRIEAQEIWFLNELNNSWEQAWVKFCPSSVLAHDAKYIGSVEYTDGSFANIYYNFGELVGIMYDENCKEVSVA